MTERNNGTLEIYRQQLTDLERAEILEETAKCLDNLSVEVSGWVNFSFPFEGRLATLLEEIFARTPESKTNKRKPFADYNKLRIRIWVGEPDHTTFSHYDAGGVVIFTANPIAEKVWFTKQCGLDVLYNTVPTHYPHFFNKTTFWGDNVDLVKSGDVNIMPELTYHAIKYTSITSVSVDVECREKDFSLRTWPMWVTSLKARWYPSRDSWFYYFIHLILCFISLCLACFHPLETLRGYYNGYRYTSYDATLKRIQLSKSRTGWMREQATALRRGAKQAVNGKR